MRKLIFILIALVSFSQAQTIQYIGAPTTTVISRGNFRTDSIFYLPKRTKLPTDTAAFRYQISDSSLYYWTGYQWMKVGNNQDTASMLSNYVRGSGTTNYFPKFNSTRSIVDSKLYESNLNLLFNSTTPYLTTSGISTIENNGTSAALYVLKTLDTARAYVSFGGANTMDINNLRAGDIRFYTNATLRGRFQTDGTFRLNSLTGTGSRIVVADDNGVLSATSSATGLVDTTLLSTRAYRQKGDDSLGAIIATKGSGTVTSVATGYGLSGGTITTTGTLIADTLNLSTRAWRQKGLDSLAALEISGSGTTNYVPKFTASRTIGNSQIFDNGNAIGIGFTPNTWSGFTPIQINSTSFVGNNTLDRGYVLSNAYYDGSSLRYINSNTASRYDIEGSTGSHIWFNAASGTAGNVITFSQAMTLNNTNELLVNTSTDAGDYKLQVNGNIYHTGNAILSATSGNVGIGTTSPLALLDISSTAPLIQFTDKTTATSERNFRMGISEVAEGDFYISQEAGDETNLYGIKFYINPSGELLINTTTDAGAYTLQNNGALYNTGSAILAANGTSHVGIGTLPSAWSWPNTIMQFRFGGHIAVADNSFMQIGANSYYDGSNYVRVNAGYASRYLQNDGGHFWASATTSTAGSTVTFSENMRLTRDAELLIGTTTDAGNYRVQVSGAVYIDNPSNVALQIGGGQAIRTAGTLYTDFGTSGTGDYVIRAGSGFNTGLAIDNNGNVGINTNTPGYKLDVLGIMSNNNSAYFATSTGNVGIGTTSPSQKLSVNGIGSFNTRLVFNGINQLVGDGNQFSSGGGTNGFGIRNDSGQVMLASGGSTPQYRLNTSGESLFGTTTDAGNYRVQVSGNAYVSGLLSLGTTSTSYTFNAVSSDATIGAFRNSGAANAQLLVGNTAGDLTIRASSTGDAFIYSDVGKYIDFGTNGSTFRMRLTSDGILGVGTNSPSASALLDVSSTTRGFLPPRMTTTQRDAISSPAAGLVIYNTTTSKLQVYTTSWTDLH